MQLILIFVCALLLEAASTKYIQAVAEKAVKKAAFWAFISPLLNLPFYNELIESEAWSERILAAIVLGIGYAVGSVLAMRNSKKSINDKSTNRNETD